MQERNSQAGRHKGARQNCLAPLFDIHIMASPGPPGRRDGARLPGAIQQCTPCQGKHAVVIIDAVHGLGDLLPSPFLLEERKLQIVLREISEGDSQKSNRLLEPERGENLPCNEIDFGTVID